MEGNEAEEGAIEGLLGLIRPPRLEDAGLEDCALPPESIAEAFSRAAASLRSRVATSFSGNIEEDADGDRGGCVQDPGPSNGQIPDKLLGASEVSSPALPLCGGTGKKVERVGDKDDVVVIGAVDGDSATDRVVVLGNDGNDSESGIGGNRGCAVDGEVIQGKNGSGNGADDLDDDEENQEGAILVEDLI